MISLQPQARFGVGFWMAVAVAVAAVLSAAVLAVFGRQQRGLDVALMLLGRWAFLLFWPAYAGAGLVALLGERFNTVKRHGREFGLAFAGSMLVHVGLIGWLCVIGAAPATGVFVFFGIGLFCAYMLALFSIRSLQQRLGRRMWWLLRTSAMNYIAYAFATDFLNQPFRLGPKHMLIYAPFALLSLLGFALHASGQVVSTRKALMAT